MKYIYIAHPISGDQYRNTKRVIEIVKSINTGTSGNVHAVAPYIVDCLTLDDQNSDHRNRGIASNLKYLSSGIVSEMWLFGDKVSNGMIAEIRICNKLGIDVISRLDPNADISKLKDSQLLITQ